MEVNLVMILFVSSCGSCTFTCFADRWLFVVKNWFSNFSALLYTKTYWMINYKHKSVQVFDPVFTFQNSVCLCIHIQYCVKNDRK